MTKNLNFFQRKDIFGVILGSLFLDPEKSFLSHRRCHFRVWDLWPNGVSQGLGDPNILPSNHKPPFLSKPSFHGKRGQLGGKGSLCGGRFFPQREDIPSDGVLGQFSHRANMASKSVYHPLQNHFTHETSIWNYSGVSGAFALMSLQKQFLVLLVEYSYRKNCLGGFQSFPEVAVT